MKKLLFLYPSIDHRHTSSIAELSPNEVEYVSGGIGSFMGFALVSAASIGIIYVGEITGISDYIRSKTSLKSALNFLYKLAAVSFYAVYVGVVVFVCSVAVNRFGGGLGVNQAPGVKKVCSLTALGYVKMFLGR